MAEFKPPKEFKKGYEFKEFSFNPDIIPWINTAQVDYNISVDWWVNSVIWWTNISINNTDPDNPIINSTV